MDWEQHVKREIDEIEKLKSQGLTIRKILDKNEFSYDALKAAGLPVSYLIPKMKRQKLTLKEWNTHTSAEHKWELYDGVPFGQEEERDRVMIGLIYSAGLQHVLDILPEESKMELIKLIKKSR